MIPSSARVWIAMGHTEMRKGVQGLALLVQLAELHARLTAQLARLSRTTTSPRPSTTCFDAGAPSPVSSTTAGSA